MKDNLRHWARCLIACPPAKLQIGIGHTAMRMGNALQRWLDSHGLLAIAAGVLGVITALSVLLVLAGYLFVAP